MKEEELGGVEKGFHLQELKRYVQIPNSHFFCHCFLYFLSSLSYTFPLFLLLHLFAGCPPSIFILKDDVSLGSMYHSSLGFDDGEVE